MQFTVYSFFFFFSPGEFLLQKMHIVFLCFPSFTIDVRRKALGCFVQQVLNLLLRKVAFFLFWLFFCGFRGQGTETGSRSLPLIYYPVCYHLSASHFNLLMESPVWMCHGAWEISIFLSCLTSEPVGTLPPRPPVRSVDVENTNPRESVGIVSFFIRAFIPLPLHTQVKYRCLF